MPARPFLSQNKLLFGAMALLIILSLVLGRKSGPATQTNNAASSARGAAPQSAPPSSGAGGREASAGDEPFYPDTVIPRGWALVPLELENIRAVAGLIGHFGVIDLYGRDQAGKTALLASRIRILQAPLNPDQYAVLAEDALARKIMLARGPYWGSVRNRRVLKADSLTPGPPPRTPHTSRVRRRTPPRLEVEYYQGENP